MYIYLGKNKNTIYKLKTREVWSKIKENCLLRSVKNANIMVFVYNTRIHATSFGGIVCENCRSL